MVRPFQTRHSRCVCVPASSSFRCHTPCTTLPSPFFLLLPTYLVPIIVVTQTQIRGHIVAPPPRPPPTRTVRYAPCVFIARRVDHVLPSSTRVLSYWRKSARERGVLTFRASRTEYTHESLRRDDALPGWSLISCNKHTYEVPAASAALLVQSVDHETMTTVFYIRIICMHECQYRTSPTAAVSHSYMQQLPTWSSSIYRPVIEKGAFTDKKRVALIVTGSNERTRCRIFFPAT